MQQATQAAPSVPPAPPQPGAPTVTAVNPYDGQPMVVTYRPGAANPTSQYEAFLAQREELGQQLENLQHRRNRITEELSNSDTRGADRTGLESRLTALDARIAEVDKAIAAADARVSAAAAVPTAVAGHEARLRAERQADHANETDPGPYLVGSLFMVVVLLPLSIAYARRIWRRGAKPVAAIPADVAERFSRLDQAMESIAIEVERIGEGQRFMTRVMTDANSRALGVGAAEPVRQGVREGMPVGSGEPGGR